LTYAILLVLGALDAAGYSVIAPVVPEIAEATSTGPGMIGALIATFPVGMVIGFAAAGAGVKRHGAKLTIAAALALIALGCAGFIFGNGLTVYFITRGLMGVGSGGLWIGITFTTLARWPGQEYLCMSRIFAAYSAGGLVGPALGAINGIHGPFLAYAVLLGCALVLTSLLPAPAEMRTFASDRSALHLLGFWAASAAILFTVLALGVIEGVVPLQLSRRLEQTEIGLLYASVSLLVAASAAIAARFAPQVDVFAAAGLITVGLAVAGATDSVAPWIAGLALAGIGIGLGNTGSIGLLLGSVRPERIVTAMIVWSQIGIVGYLLGPVAAGFVAQSLGFAALGLVPLAAAVVLLRAMRWAPARRSAGATASVGIPSSP
jgi:MFS family permease